MLMGEFLTAVHHRLPVKVIIYNNSAFGLIPLEAEALASLPFREAIEFPNPDFAALARACGGHGFTAAKAERTEGGDQRGVRSRRPGNHRRRRGANEMPNMPHVELEQLGNFAMAKIKEAVLAVTAG